MAKTHGTNPLIEAEPSAIANAVSGITPLLNVGKVSATDSEAVRERINGYFKHCEQSELIPTVEGLALALGIDRSTLWRWEKGNGCSYEVMEIIKQTKLILGAIDAELALKQKISPVVSIFRAKNYFGLTDAVRIEADTTPQRVKPIEEIAQRYADLVSVDPKEKPIEE